MSMILTALLAPGLLTLGNPPQAAQVLYTPARTFTDQSIKAAGWGSGTGGESDETFYEGAHSIRVSTRNFFTGVRLDYTTPVDLSGRFADKNNLLKLVVKTSDATATGGMPGGPDGGRPGMGSGSGSMGPGGGRPGMGGGRPGGMGAPGGGGPGGMGGPGMGGGRLPGTGGQGGGRLPGTGGQSGGRLPGTSGGMMGGSGMGGAPTAPSLNTVRMIVTTTDGKKSEAYLPVSTSTGGERGWKTVAIPLQAISGFDRTNKTIKDIAFSGDSTTTFYVGDMRVVNDATAIRGEILGRRTYNLALGDKVPFVGQAQGGASVLEYVWDFDDSDGLQEDAVGQSIVHQFRKATPPGGKTIVTLTVRDKYGLKPPFKTTVEVVVNP